MHFFFFRIYLFLKKCISGQNIMSSSPLSSSNLQTDTEKQRKRNNSRYFLSIRTLGNKTPFPTFTSHFAFHSSQHNILKRHQQLSLHSLCSSHQWLLASPSSLRLHFSSCFSVRTFYLFVFSFSYFVSHNVGASNFSFLFLHI